MNISIKTGAILFLYLTAEGTSAQIFSARLLNIVEYLWKYSIKLYVKYLRKIFTTLTVPENDTHLYHSCALNMFGAALE